MTSQEKALSAHCTQQTIVEGRVRLHQLPMAIRSLRLVSYQGATNRNVILCRFCMNPTCTVQLLLGAHFSFLTTGRTPPPVGVSLTCNHALWQSNACLKNTSEVGLSDLHIREDYYRCLVETSDMLQTETFPVKERDETAVVE
jgi:hypothetical protein